MKNLISNASRMFEQFSKKLDELINDKNIAVAVSGGSDSMALVLLADEYCKQKNISLTAITVDHKLRDESTEEARQVGIWLQNKNIKHVILEWEDAKPISNIQSAARDSRYRLLTDFCNQSKINNLLIAHNIEDQAETFIDRLFRGSGIDGLSAMQEVINKNNVNIIRPLLAISNKDLKIYLQENNQKWLEDPSNINEKYNRVKIRNLLNSLDDKDLVISRIALTAENISRSKDYVEKQIKKQIDEIVDIYDEGYCTIDHEKYCALDIEIAYKILAKLLSLISGKYYKPRFEKLKNLYLKITESDNNKGITLWGCKIILNNSKIIVFREINSIKPAKIIQNEQVWDNRYIVKVENFNINEPLYICPLGQKGYLKLCKENHNLNLLNIPKQVFYTLPSFKVLEKTVAVPQINYYIQEKYKKFESIFCKNML